MVAVTNWAVEPEYSSEALADELSTNISTHVATKGDIEKLEIRMESLETRLFAKLLLSQIVVVGAWFAIVGVIVALLVPYFTA